MRRQLTLLLLMSSLLLTSCSHGKRNLPAGAQNGRTVYFAPIGDVSSSTLQSLVAHYQREFGLDVQILAPMQLDPRDFNVQRNQFAAELLTRRMQENYRALAGNPKNIIIGITNSDMYLLSVNWRYCFGWRANAHLAVVSTARLNIYYFGQPLFGTSPQARLEKIITKDLGLLYFDRPLSNDPHSVLYNNILSIGDLDQTSESF